MLLRDDLDVVDTLPPAVSVEIIWGSKSLIFLIDININKQRLYLDTLR